jgi:ATP-dependent DNA helicase RecQ
VIFGDEPLRDFARYRPTTVARFATIRGVGEQKKQDFANVFVEAIRDYCAQNQLSTDLDTNAKPAPVESSVVVPKANSFAAFEYFRRGDSLEDIAKKLDRAYSTICSYLEDYLRHEKITDCTPWVDKETRDQVIAQAHLVENRRVKPLFEHFNAKISYETLRIIMICHENAK